MHRLLAIILFILAHHASAQLIYTGTVVDANTGDPLPFVNILADDQKNGFVTDIDGQFRIHTATKISGLRFFYIGYEQKTYALADDEQKGIVVSMKKKPVGLKEVVVVAGENPAHRIILKASANREFNDPENLAGFTYESYNKLIVTADSLEKVQSSAMDTSLEAAKKFFKSNHMFLSESVTKRQYRYKGLSNEKILASRVSGLNNPLFTLLGTQFQSFSFYKDHITVSDKNYLNPISPNAIKKYIFILEDTSFTTSDTVFQIRFEPRQGKNFEGLKGVLYINTHGYAVQNVIAEPSGPEATRVKIQQLYELVDDKWFPTQLNTDILFGGLAINGRPLKGNARTYLSAIRIGDALPKSQFSEVVVEVDKDAMTKDERFWQAYRKDSLTVKDKKTYHVIDSIGKEAKLEEKILLLNSFMTGRYPLGYIDIDLSRIIDYNRHEGYRLGTGLYTNNRVSRHFSTGGYFAYGTDDKSWKYGGSLTLKTKKVKDGTLEFSYIDDVTESGSPGEFLRKQSLLAEDYRRLSVNMMDQVKATSASATFRWLKYLHTSFAVEHFERLPLYIQNEHFVYSSTEVKAMFRYVYKEKFMQLLGDPISLGSDRPVLWLSITKGINGFLQGAYDYLRTDFMIRDELLIRNVGTFSYIVKAGDLSGIKGIPFSYHIRGSYLDWGLYDDESFQTMGVNEFFTTQYLNVFIKHDFGSLLFKTRHFSPTLGITSAAGLMKGAATLNTPYLESGLLLQDLIKVSFMKLGLGGFYRYGYHQVPQLRDNVTIKSVLKISF